MSTSEINVSVGRAIKTIRELMGLRAIDLAEKVGVTQQQIGKYESGINGVSIDKLHAIAEALGRSVCDFLPPPPAGHVSHPGVGAEVVQQLADNADALLFVAGDLKAVQTKFDAIKGMLREAGDV